MTNLSMVFYNSLFHNFSTIEKYLHTSTCIAWGLCLFFYQTFLICLRPFLASSAQPTKPGTSRAPARHESYMKLPDIIFSKGMRGRPSARTHRLKRAWNIHCPRLALTYVRVERYRCRCRESILYNKCRWNFVTNLAALFFFHAFRRNAPCLVTFTTRDWKIRNCSTRMEQFSRSPLSTLLSGNFSIFSLFLRWNSRGCIFGREFPILFVRYRNGVDIICLYSLILIFDVTRVSWSKIELKSVIRRKRASASGGKTSPLRHENLD